MHGITISFTDSLDVSIGNNVPQIDPSDFTGSYSQLNTVHVLPYLSFKTQQTKIFGFSVYAGGPGTLTLMVRKLSIAHIGQCFYFYGNNAYREKDNTRCSGFSYIVYNGWMLHWY